MTNYYYDWLCVMNALDVLKTEEIITNETKNSLQDHLLNLKSLVLDAEEDDYVSFKQLAIMAGKIISGCHPGDEEWSRFDQIAYDFVMGYKE